MSTIPNSALDPFVEEERSNFARLFLTLDDDAGNNQVNRLPSDHDFSSGRPVTLTDQILVGLFQDNVLFDFQVDDNAAGGGSDDVELAEAAVLFGPFDPFVPLFPIIPPPHPAMFDIRLNSILIREEGFDEIGDSDAEWQLDIGFGSVPAITRFRLADDSVNTGDRFGSTASPLAVLPVVPASAFISREGDFSFNLGVHAAGKELDILTADDNLPTLDANFPFSLSDYTTTFPIRERGGFGGFAYTLNFTVDSHVNELLTGNDGERDILRASNGPAILAGRGGDDSLVGSSHNDFFIGGRGDDFMTGFAGRDSFIFGGNTGRDVITDFTDGEDVIDLSTGSSRLDFDDISRAATAGPPVPLGGRLVDQTVIDLDSAAGFLPQGNILTVLGLSRNALDPTDFIFG